jgi:hypothetical protein
LLHDLEDNPINTRKLMETNRSIKFYYVLTVIMVFAISFLLKRLDDAFFFQSIALVIFSILGYFNFSLSNKIKKSKKAFKMPKIRKLLISQILLLLVVLISQTLVWSGNKHLIAIFIVQVLIVFIFMISLFWKIDTYSRV